MSLNILASTHDTFHHDILSSIDIETEQHRRYIEAQQDSSYTFPSLQSPERSTSDCRNVFTKLQWLSDGSTLLASSEDNALRLYITSPTLLQDEDAQLIPFTRSFQTPLIATERHPRASIYEGSVPVLVSSNDLPLKLVDLIPQDDGRAATLSIYDTQHRQTEKYLKIQSMKFLDDSIFACGLSGKTMVFDVKRSEPLIQTRCQGIVSCFERCASEFMDSGAFYSGTFSNWVSVHDSNGEVVMQEKLDVGTGITQILEAKNGKYAFVLSRNSDAITVLDVRMGLKEVMRLPHTSKTQRLYADLLPSSQGLLCGTSDGLINHHTDAELGMDTVATYDKFQGSSVPAITVNPAEPSVMAISHGDRDYNGPSVNIACIS